jgi:hypothetical protein
MSPRLTLLLIIACAIALSGCAHRFTGDVVFMNKSTTKLWAEVSGFDDNPRCGVLVPGASASSMVGYIRIPQQATLSWCEGTACYNDPKARWVKSVVSLPSSCSAGTRIVFAYSSDQTWGVHCH